MFLWNRQTTYITDVPFLRKICQDSFIHSMNVFISHTFYFHSTDTKAEAQETERFVSDLA